jgi:uncharacterized damage-inducible protein DinB
MYGLMLWVVGTAGVRVAAAEAGYAELLQTHWSRLRGMLTDIVSAMPEDKWDYRPVKEVRSFREMAVHLIQDGITHTGWAAGISREESEKIAAKYENYKTREEVLKGLGEMFDYGHKVLGTINDTNARQMILGMRSQPMTRFEAALVAFEDQMDHYGNFVVYLRLNGVVPPSTANAAKEREENLRKAKELGLTPAPEGEHEHESMPEMKMDDMQPGMDDMQMMM